MTEPNPAPDPHEGAAPVPGVATVTGPNTGDEPSHMSEAPTSVASLVTHLDKPLQHLLVTLLKVPSQSVILSAIEQEGITELNQPGLLPTSSDSHWRGTTSGYITYWCEQMRTLESLIEDPQDLPSDQSKKRQLMAALAGVPELLFHPNYG